MRFCSVRQNMINQSLSQSQKLLKKSKQLRKRQRLLHKTICFQSFYSHFNKSKRMKNKFPIKALKMYQTLQICLSQPMRIKRNQNNSGKKKETKMTNLRSFTKKWKNSMKNSMRWPKLLYYCDSAKTPKKVEFWYLSLFYCYPNLT